MNDRSFVLDEMNLIELDRMLKVVNLKSPIIFCECPSISVMKVGLSLKGQSKRMRKVVGCR